MMILKRLVAASGLVLCVIVLAGCGGLDSGPADPSTVPKVEPKVIENALSNEQSRKYMPKGAKVPTGAAPAAQPEK